MRRSGRPAARRVAGEAVALVFLIVQGLLAIRVLLRLAATARGSRIAAAPDGAQVEPVAVLVPVLNEEGRLGPCLDGLLRQGPAVAEILVVDGGSTDGTAAVVAHYAARDPRVRFVDNAAPPAGNGKVHNLETGFRQARPDAAWILTIDADVRPEPPLARSLVAFAVDRGIGALSVATTQRLSGPAEALLHPSLLATLVYRFGIPGRATTDVAAVQANGQCFLIRRDLLEEVGGFAPLRDSVCEDVTLARTLAAAGHPVGFYEADRLVSVEMYAGWRDAWDGWSRSLPMRDRFWGAAGRRGLLEVALVQALPLPVAILLATRRRGRVADALLRVQAALVAVRLGVLIGSSRAYATRPPPLWLSPLSDLPVAGRLWLSALRRRHVWRGRTLVRGGDR